jgi:hypothetical protein
MELFPTLSLNRFRSIPLLTFLFLLNSLRGATPLLLTITLNRFRGVTLLTFLFAPNAFGLPTLPLYFALPLFCLIPQFGLPQGFSPIDRTSRGLLRPCSLLSFGCLLTHPLCFSPLLFLLQAIAPAPQPDAETFQVGLHVLNIQWPIRRCLDSTDHRRKFWLVPSVEMLQHPFTGHAGLFPAVHPLGCARHALFSTRRIRSGPRPFGIGRAAVLLSLLISGPGFPRFSSVREGWEVLH